MSMSMEREWELEGGVVVGVVDVVRECSFQHSEGRRPLTSELVMWTLARPGLPGSRLDALK